MILRDSEEARTQAAAIIARGGVIAFRTDTFYGLGVDPFSQPALHRIRKLKRREEEKPILILIGDVCDLNRFVAERSALFDRVCELFWPGPLTLVGKARPELPAELTAGTGTIGLRLPDDNAARGLLRHCGGALTATSANPSGKPAARSASEVETYFPNGVDLIIDGGSARTGQPSSVVDLSGSTPRIIREGVIGGQELQRLLLSV